ncbi:MAG: integrase [Lachnospiraceae bacterium]|nr:integrase [Lachnospiraceae bacterium]
MAIENYHEQVSKDMVVKLREVIKELPKFAATFFRGIEPQTAARTRLAYAYDLRIFFNYIKETNPLYKDKDISEIPLSLLDELTHMDIEEYMEYLKLYNKDDQEIVNHEKGIKRKMSALRKFYSYFYNHEMIKNNPASMINMPKLHQKEIIRLETNEVAILLDEAERGDKLTKNQQYFHEKTKNRDLALLTLLLGTGIRVSECVGLDINDINFDNSCIKVRRKGGNEATVYFGDEVEEALRTYLEERKGIITVEGHENALFLSIQRKRLTVRSVEKLVLKYSSIVTTMKKITPHKLRSTYGTNLYRETGDIYLVADVLGHKDVNTTKRHYADIDDNRRYKARNKVKLRED